MTLISRSADDRLQVHSAARRNRRLQDIVLTLAFFLSVGFAAAVVFGII